jgi:hypothetical protein
MSDREKIANKIRALLNMSTANGCTESEAMNAAERANALMRDYNLTALDVSESTPEAYGRRGVKFAQGGNKRRRFPEASQCLMSIGNFTDCIVYMQGATLVFFGKKHDTEFASYLTDMIQNVMVSEYEANKSVLKKRFPHQHGKHLRKSFMLGMAERICERLNDLKNQRDDYVSAHASNALVVQEKAKLQEMFDKMNVKLKSTAVSRKIAINKHAFENGIESANGVSIGRPVANNNVSAYLK